MIDELAPERPEPRPTTEGIRRSISVRWRRVAKGCRRWLRRNPSFDGRLSSPPTSRELESQMESLAAQCANLAPISSDIESKFLAIGTALEELPAVSDALVKRSERLLTLASGRDDGESILESTLAVLREPMAYIDHYRESMVGLLVQLRQAGEHIDRVLACERPLQRTIAPLKFIRTLFRVESSGLSHEVQNMFIALTEDIAGLQQQVSETFSSKFEVLKDSKVMVDTVAGRLEAYGRGQDRTVEAKRREMQDALDELKADLARNRVRDIKLTQVSRAISQEVGTLVFSLQSQDIISQKVAHVIASMRSIEDKFLEYKKAGSAATQANLLAYFGHAARVEQAQLAAIRDDLMQTESRLSGAIGKVDAQISDLNADSFSRQEFDRETAGFPGLIQVLLDALNDVRELVSATVATAGDAFESIRPLGGQASNVTSTMRQLSAQIKLIALNAQVQAARIGTDTGLEVLAAATAGVAAETAQISEAIAEDLDRLSVELDALVRGFSELRDRGAGHKDQWELETRRQENGLHESRDATLAELHGIGEATEKIRTLAGTMKGKFELRSIAEDRIEDARLALAGLADIASCILQSPEMAGQKPAAEAEFSRDITMESERLIQESVLAGRPVGPSATATATGLVSAATTSPDVDACLFDDFSSEGQPNSAALPDPSMMVSVKQIEVTSTPQPLPSTKGNTELGGNVELF